MNMFLELHKNEYPVITDAIVRMHWMPNKALVYSKIEDRTKELYEYNMDPISTEYAELLSQITGTQTLGQIIEINGKNKDIPALIENAYLREWVKFSENKSISPKMKTTGDRNYFFPPHLAIELTDKCNLSCKHCYRNAKHEGTFIDKSKLFDLIDQLSGEGLELVEVTGGEPTLHPDIVEIIEYLVSKLGLVAVLTNGANVNKNVIDTFIGSKGKVLVNISIDSSTPDFHDAFRGVKGCWQQSCKAVKELADNGVLVRVAMSVTPENMFDVESTLLLAKNLGAQSFAWEQCSPQGRGVNISWKDVSEYDYLEYERISKCLRKKYNELINFLPPKSSRMMSLGLENCGGGWRTFTIGPNGDVRMCVNSPLKMFSFGNVFNDGISVFNNKLLSILSDTPLPRYSTCKDCKLYTYCSKCTVRGLTGAANMDSCSWEGKELLKYINRDQLENGTIDCSMRKTIRI